MKKKGLTMRVGEFIHLHFYSLQIVQVLVDEYVCWKDGNFYVYHPYQGVRKI